MTSRATLLLASVFLAIAATLSWGQTMHPVTAPRVINPAAVNAVDTQDLINKLTGAADLGGRVPKDPTRALQTIVGRMDQSSSRLGDKNPGLQTQEIQSRIVAELDSLIRRLEQNQTPHNPGSPRAPGQTPPSPAQRVSAEKTAAGGNTPATTSQPRAGNPTSPLAADDLLEKRVEGMNLPPRDRGAILNGITHGCLPEYKNMICKYYEALAELRTTNRAH